MKCNIVQCTLRLAVVNSELHQHLLQWRGCIVIMCIVPSVVQCSPSAVKDSAAALCGVATWLVIEQETNLLHWLFCIKTFLDFLIILICKFSLEFLFYTLAKELILSTRNIWLYKILKPQKNVCWRKQSKIVRCLSGIDKYTNS